MNDDAKAEDGLAVANLAGRFVSAAFVARVGIYAAALALWPVLLARWPWLLADAD
jgi:hypothetical protein